MKRYSKYAASLVAGLLVCASMGVAHASPVAVQGAKMPPAARAELRNVIAKARVTDAAVFRQVKEIAAGARQADAHARARKAPISLRLSALGPRAVLPMLDLLAFESGAYAPNESAVDRASVQRDLLEAVGMLRDPRALPVLTIAASQVGDFATMRTSAEALARLDSEAAATALLAALAQSTGQQSEALLAGMGACHSLRVAQVLAGRLAAHPADAQAKLIARSLGSVGNAWAWQTLTSRTDEATVRELAATALMTAYVQYAGEAREGVAKALLVVSDPHTRALIASARVGAPAAIASALDELAARVDANPIR